MRDLDPDAQPVSATVLSVRLRKGLYLARVSVPGFVQPETAPDLGLYHQGDALPDAFVSHIEHETWQIEVPIPSRLLNEGVCTLILARHSGADILHSYPLLAGLPLAEDLT